MTNKVVGGFLLLLVFLFCIPGVTVFSQSQTKKPSRYVDGEILVKFRDDLSPFEDRDQIADALFPVPEIRSEALSPTNDPNLRLIRLNGRLSVEDAVSRAQADSRVDHAEPNFLYYTKETIPNDEWFKQQWGMFKDLCTGCPPPGNIDTLHAWDITTGRDDIVVAVIDTGVDLSHPDLAPNAWMNPGEVPANGQDDDGNGYIDDVNGWNFANDNNKVYKDFDTDFHGTHVAGTIGAVGNNQIGVAGVAWHVKLMSVKFIGKKSGEGSLSDAIKSIEYVIDQKKRGVNIMAINASWGGPDNSSLLRDAIVKAGKADILFVCAAGNETEDVDEVPSYPVAYSSDISTLVSVAATWSGGVLAPFSNYGHRSVSVGAPGWDIVSTQAGGWYVYLSGTSMATPHVTGIAVLLWAHEPSLTPAQVKQRIVETAEPQNSFASKSVSSGYANAYNALINRIPTVSKPSISELRVNKKKIILDGIGFVNGSSVIEVNGAAVPVTDYDESYLVPSGALTRLTANLGKKNIKRSFPSGIPVPVNVYNPTTGDRSDKRYFIRE